MKRRASVRRKNFLPAFILAVIFWLLWGGIVYFTSPQSTFLLFTFYFLLFFALFFTTALIFANSRLGFLIALFIITTLIFRYLQVGNILNILLLGGIFITLSLYILR